MSQCIEVENGFICLARVEFICPHCRKQYNDSDEKYLKRSLANKSGYTKIKCTCGETFGMTYDITGDAVGFKLKDENNLIICR
jgi:transposase-like protein